MGVDEGNKRIMYSTWLYLLDKDNKLSMTPNVISRYRPKTRGEEGTKLSIYQLGDTILREAI
jgi:hypothetical protein